VRERERMRTGKIGTEIGHSGPEKAEFQILEQLLRFELHLRWTRSNELVRFERTTEEGSSDEMPSNHLTGEREREREREKRDGLKIW
jgi:hypothetical protein